MIELEHIVKKFSSESGHTVDAVNDVSLKINDGDIYGIIGFSGAGKSTLVRCINLLERPTSGRVRIDGVEMTELAPRDLYKARRKIGMIFQHFNLMPSRTVGENVAYPLKGSGLSRDQIKAKVKELLELVEISDKLESYPAELSGGQKQRVAIARALANDPKILLCDEATSALDPQTTASILALIKSLNQRFGLTVVVITHEMAVVKSICTRAAVMDHGCLVETGSAYEIFSKPEHPVTKNFVNSTSNLAKAEGLVQDNADVVKLEPGQVLARLIYRKGGVSTPLISTTARKFDLDLNIVLADVEIVAGETIGGTVVIFGDPYAGNPSAKSGERENGRQRIRDAIQFLKDCNVGVEVINDAGVLG